MKSLRAVLAASLILSSVVISGFGQASSGGTPSEPIRLDQGAVNNPLKIAQLKWYISNSHTLFPVGSQPLGVCFDGENIWVANYGDNTVSKLRASDGAPQGRFTVPAQPTGLAFDGANIWNQQRLE